MCGNSYVANILRQRSVEQGGNMRKVLLTFTLFWVKLCFKMCKGDDQEELREIVRILEKHASKLSTVAKAVRMYLEGKTQSQSFQEWVDVAQSDFATEEELICISIKCIYISCYYSHEKALLDQVELAKAISQNPNVTEQAIRNLKLSYYPEVVEIAEAWLKEHCENET